ncbi:MAG: transglutaminase family protein [Chitinophagaceae bacterium]
MSLNAMSNNREIESLFKLIDDPDAEVFSIVSDRIVNYGNIIIPNLEDLWENTACNTAQKRIEILIHKLQYAELQNDLTEWSSSSYNDLLFGALLVAKYQYPDLHTTPILQDLDRIKRNIWLELNNHLTPLEQANVLCSILYNYYELSGSEVSYESPNDFFINKVLESKRGNAISMGILYQVMCDLLDINASIINIPKQMIIAFYHSDFYADKSNDDNRDKIHFYVDAVNGQAYSYRDIQNYFKRIGVTPTAQHFKPLSHKRTIQILLEEVGKCFYNSNLVEKKEEVTALAKILY